MLPHETKLPDSGTSSLTADTHIWVWFSIATPSICSGGILFEG